MQAVDLSRELLGFAAEGAAAQGLTNLRIRVGDFESTGYADGAFDVVLCSLGIFFTTDIPAALRELWRMVAPGGRLAISTWAGQGIEQIFESFGAAIKEVWPEVPDDDAMLWDALATPMGLSAAFESAGAAKPLVTPFQLSEPIEGGRMWANFMGGGIRGLLDRFTPEQQAQIRDGLASRLAARGIDAFEYDLLFAVATR